METINIAVTGSLAAVTENLPVVSGTVGLPVSFTFDDAWEGLNKTAVFRVNGKSLDRLNIAQETTVPWELLKNPGCRLWAGVYGTNADGTLQIPTVWADLGIIQPGADPSGDESADPSLQVWEQVGKDAVKYTPQALTEEQQAQARENIGAMQNGVADTKLDMTLHPISNIKSIALIVPDGVDYEHPLNDVVIQVVDNAIQFYGLETILRGLTPGTQFDDAVTVGQLNDAVGDIEAALDGILAIQASLIGGAAI